MAQPFTTFLLLFPFLLSSSLASDQIKFWSENVLNKMPQSISSKLSPLTSLKSDYYAKTISENNFKADPNFCSLAKLACSTLYYEIKPVKEAYAVVKTYNNNKFAVPLQNMDPFSFFRVSNLKEGNTIRLSNLKESLPYRAFLPNQIASKISLTPQKITKLFPESNKQAIDMTLSYCNAATIKGEVKACPKSLEEMITFSKNVLSKNKLLSLASQSTKGSGNMVTVRKVKQFNVEKFVACHEMFLPFATYFCHSISSSRIYAVDFVEPKTGAPVNRVVAICHMDTSSWPSDHVAFKILKYAPGEGEACHWMNEIDLAWIDGEEEK